MTIRSDGFNFMKFVHFRPAKSNKDVRKAAEQNKKRRPKRAEKGFDPTTETLRYKAALRELRGLNFSRDVTTNPHDKKKSFLTLSEHGVQRLSDETKATLDEAGVDTNRHTHYQIRDILDQHLIDQVNPASVFTAEADGAGNVPVGQLQSVGTAHLMVVKQHVKRYEPAEIAHIENVLSGEEKARHHKVLTRTEETFSTTSETTTETEESLDTTERFELEKETEKVFERETELGAELSLSGKYGPTVSFDSNFSAGQTTSQSNSASQASTFARETVERSRERVVAKVTTARENKLIREIVHSNDHSQSNKGEEHRVGIYQFVDKVYESQVFDYGRRQMFDFMLPEPASFYWFLRQSKALESDENAPRKLEEMDIQSARDITRHNYLNLAAAYGVTDLPEPPTIKTTRRVRLAHNNGSVSDSTVHKSGVSAELDIPPGYVPIRIHPTILATSDETLHLTLHVGGTILNFAKADFEEVSVGGEHKRYTISSPAGFWIITPQSELMSVGEEKLYFDVYAYESANYSIQIEIEFYASYDQVEGEHFVITKWQKEVHGLLTEAYRDALYLWRQDRAVAQAALAATMRDTTDFGAPPAAVNKMISDELKKHAIAIIRASHLGEDATGHSGKPPKFSITDALLDGEEVRFLEHAFEWGQMQYVFYPYYWARPLDDCSGWTDRALSQNPSFTMEEFLKAGYARVVVPVREGFDRAVSYFIENGEVFSGEGQPDVTNPLYISIVDEIRERTQAGKDEIAVDEPWETRLPTSAVIVRRQETLPTWTRPDPEEWKWQPDL